MKTMKMNFKYVMMAAALTAGFASCSNDNDEQQPVMNANSHSVTVKVATKAGGTRASEATAVGIAPTLADLTLFFVDNVGGTVTAVHSANLTNIQGAGESITNLPAGTNTIYAVGNLTKVASASISAIVVNDTEAALQAALLDAKNHSGVAATDVNVYGYTTYAVLANQTSVNVAFDIYPAVSRMEIAQVEADQTVLAADRVTQFDLDAIFINNTYEDIALDLVNYGTPVAYTNVDPIWATPATYPSAYRDVITGTGSIIYTPTPSTNRWSYYVAPAAKQVAGDYVGEQIAGVQYDAKPVIVVKVSNLEVNSVPLATTTQYLTISKLKDGGGNYLDHFERGNVYEISNILFDATNLTVDPMTPPVHEVVATVIIKPWTGVATTPEF